MGTGRLLVWAMASAASLGLAACGKTFPAGERLLPQSYGPPFGAALKANLPEHPHNPGGDERHAAPYSGENKTYRSHAACHGALQAAVSAHHGKVARISSIESVGLYEQAGIVHEHRCSDYTASYRAWCKGAGADGNGHGAATAHKKPGEGCKGEGSGH